MAVSGFEGFEKRLELRFSGDDPSVGRGLRRLDFPSLEKVLHGVRCAVVSAVGNEHLDSYVLSESSLFVYPTRIIIKTCGTTRLLRCLRPLVDHALALGLTPCGCRYTRGAFIFPEAQPHPHSSFKEEVSYLEHNLPKNLSCRKARLMGSTWNVFTAGDVGHMLATEGDDHLYTVEICMTGLDRARAGRFFRRFADGETGDSAGQEMTEATGIRDVNRNALICDYAFDPCGYSMNAIDGDRYSTVHVTPEEGFSYASFESVGSVRYDREDFLEMIRRVVRVFCPSWLSVTTTCASSSGNEVWRGLAKAVGPLGMRLKGRAADEFPEAGRVVFQTFAAARRK